MESALSGSALDHAVARALGFWPGRMRTAADGQLETLEVANPLGPVELWARFSPTKNAELAVVLIEGARIEVSPHSMTTGPRGWRARCRSPGGESLCCADGDTFVEAALRALVGSRPG